MSPKYRVLTEGEISLLARLLSRVRWPLPYPVFVAMCKAVPMIAIDLAVIKDDRNILLTYRKDEFYDNWHIPGMILRNNDNVISRLKLVAKEELGIKIAKINFVGYYEYRDIREYGISLLFSARPASLPIDGKYFNIDKLPRKFLKTQIPEIRLLKKFYRNSK